MWKTNVGNAKKTANVHICEFLIFAWKNIKSFDFIMIDETISSLIIYHLSLNHVPLASLGIQSHPLLFTIPLNNCTVPVFTPM